jgi:hypothetical protein
MEKNECFSPLKSLIGSQYSFQRRTQFSQGNKVVHAPDSTLDGFLSTVSCVSSIQLNRPILNNLSIALN